MDIELSEVSGESAKSTAGEALLFAISPQLSASVPSPLGDARLSGLQNKRNWGMWAIATIALFHWHLGAAEAKDGPRPISLANPIYETTTDHDVRGVSLSDDGRYFAMQTEHLTQVVDLSAKVVTASIAHLPLPGNQMVVVFGQPCLVGVLRGDIEASTLSIVRCADGSEVANSRLLPKSGDGTDTPRVAQACGIVVAQTRMGIVVYDTKSARVRKDLLASIPKHFDEVFSARTPKSCDLFFGSDHPADAKTVRILRLDVRTGRAQEVVRLGARVTAESPLLLIGSNGAVSPSGRTLAIPTVRADFGPAARPWESQRLELFSAVSGRSLFDIKMPRPESVTALAFLNDSEILIGSQGGGTSILSINSRAFRPAQLDNAFTIFDYAPQPMTLVAASDRGVRAYRLQAN